MSTAISDATFDAEVLKSSIPVLVDFWAPWCGPCKAMGPILDELAQKYDGKLKVVKMNVDDNQDVPGKFNVMSIPTFIIVKNGNVVDSFVGARSKEEVSTKLEAAIAA